MADVMHVRKQRKKIRQEEGYIGAPTPSNDSARVEIIEALGVHDIVSVNICVYSG